MKKMDKFSVEETDPVIIVLSQCEVCDKRMKVYDAFNGLGKRVKQGDELDLSVNTVSAPDSSVVDRTNEFSSERKLKGFRWIRDQNFVVQVNDIMNRYFHRDDLDLDFLSEKLTLSKRPLQRKFKSLLGSTPMAYVKKFRIEKAKLLLRDTQRTITDISIDTGFNSANYFARAFKELETMTPREYRESLADSRM